MESIRRVQSSEGVAFVRAVSRLLGWSYFLCWSGSFYPQPILNYRRRSTHGLAIDFPTMNVLGFVYAQRHPASPEPTVRFNDFAFAAHSAALCILIYTQFFPSIWGFKVARSQTASRVVLGIIYGSLLSIAIVIFLVWYKHRDGAGVPGRWEWLDVVYTLGYIKLVCTVVKYCPQVWVNYKRKSTVGWSIWPMLMDFAGGILSLMQLLLDCSLQADWSGLTGNPVKLGLSNISLFFDVIFIFQHYVLYQSAEPEAPEDDHLIRQIRQGSEEEPLL